MIDLLFCNDDQSHIVKVREKNVACICNDNIKNIIFLLSISGNDAMVLIQKKCLLFVFIFVKQEFIAKGASHRRKMSIHVVPSSASELSSEVLNPESVELLPVPPNLPKVLFENTNKLENVFKFLLFQMIQFFNMDLSSAFVMFTLIRVALSGGRYCSL